YNKDMQEDKELTFDAIDTTKGCIKLFDGMLKSITFNKERMYNSATGGYTNATDAADYLVNKGMPFRDAHRVIGEITVYCINKNCAIDDMSIDEFKKFSELFDEDIYEAISLDTCVRKRLTIGAPGPDAMKKVIDINEKILGELK
ncbi:MAG TPA: argininosuccinate lyase, partial [Eubacterium sp.]|nr:argininosuccinate lyase [Eubacterium sp.]